MGKPSDSSEDLLATGKGGRELIIRVAKGYGEPVKSAIKSLRHPDYRRIVEICETRKGGNWDKLLSCYAEKLQNATDEAEKTRWRTQYHTAEQLRHLETSLLQKVYRVRVQENKKEAKPCNTLYELVSYFPSNGAKRYDGSCLDTALDCVTEEIRDAG